VLRYVLLRLGQSTLTVLGVMVVTFLLFRVVAGDVAAAWTGDKATAQMRADWRYRHGYAKPLWVNLHQRLVVTDTTSGDGLFMIQDKSGSKVTDALGLVRKALELEEGQLQAPRSDTIVGRWVWQSVWGGAGFDRDTPLEMLTYDSYSEEHVPLSAGGAARAVTISTFGGESFDVDLAGVEKVGQLIDAINNAPGNDGKVVASIGDYSATRLLDSQFFHHLLTSVTFQARSLENNKKLTTIIAERAPASLAITVPAMALGWGLSLTIASFVAYFRGRPIDKIGVFVSVLGMCIPMLAWVIYGQWAMFEINARYAYGIMHRAAIYLPIAIIVVASLGGSVRFYRTIILDETNRDYVRTARAKGVPLPGILFKHVLKNCMLPILTQLVMTIPFLMLGSLLIESYFGIPGLGDLLLGSINSRNEPILNGMVFLTAVIYTLGVLVTDVSYSIFDPRIRLR
jgi:peptide/nickel transport system permease protein